MAVPLGDAQSSAALSDSRQTRCRGRRGRREPRLLEVASSAAVHFSSPRAPLSGSSPACFRSASAFGRCCSSSKNLGIRGLAWHVPCSACHVRSPPRSVVRPRVCKQRSSPSPRIPCCHGIPSRSGVPWIPCKCGITCRMGYHAAAKYCAAAGYHAVPLRDTMPLLHILPLCDTVPPWDPSFHREFGRFYF